METMFHCPIKGYKIAAAFWAARFECKKKPRLHCGSMLVKQMDSNCDECTRSEGTVVTAISFRKPVASMQGA